MSKTADRKDISVGLQKLDGESAVYQAKFWEACAVEKAKELEEIGGLAPDEVYNDVLSRYFDSSEDGLKQVFNLCVRDQSDHALAEQRLMSHKGLQDALVEHFQYYSADDEGNLEDDAKEAFEKLNSVLGDGIQETSFAYAMRRLRLAILLKLYRLPESSAEVYHIDYDDDFIHTPFNGPSGEHKTIFRKGSQFRIPVLGMQDPIKKDALEEYLFTGKQKRKGTVHWVHLQKPKIEMVLAIGQVYRMPGTIQTTMRNLKNAQPQVHLNRHQSSTSRLEVPDKKTGQTPQIMGGDPAYEWSSLIYPGMCMDYASRRSLEKYEKWFHERQNPENRKRPGSDEPPPVFVAVVEHSIGAIWSDAGTSTIVTMCAQASYVGKWITDIATEGEWTNPDFPAKQKQKWWQCSPCCRRAKRSDGYEAVAQSDPDEDNFSDAKLEPVQEEPDPKSKSSETKKLPHSSSMERMVAMEEGSSGVEDSSGMEANDESVSCVTFDGVFEKTLMALYSQNSLLRTGTNEQLMTRIILNSTQEYLDIAELYAAAINRLNWLLEKPSVPDKDELIRKIEDAKLELGHLLRLVEPFANYVMPSLRGLATPLEIVLFQIKDIDNNINTFIPKCKALIQQCNSMTDSYDRKASDKMNSILNILTFITFVITPMQLLTGLYGMNFKIMPELEWHHGYAYFWTMSISLSLLFALLLYRCTQN
jgi:hypothetical protein